MLQALAAGNTAVEEVESGVINTQVRHLLHPSLSTTLQAVVESAELEESRVVKVARAVIIVSSSDPANSAQTLQDDVKEKIFKTFGPLAEVGGGGVTWCTTRSGAA